MGRKFLLTEDQLKSIIWAASGTAVLTSTLPDSKMLTDMVEKMLELKHITEYIGPMGATDEQTLS